MNKKRKDMVGVVRVPVYSHSDRYFRSSDDGVYWRRL